MLYDIKRYRKPYRFLLSAVLIAVFLFGLTGECEGITDLEAAGENRFVCSFEGIKHGFIVDLPAEPENSPLVLMLHGYGGTAESFRLTAGFEQDANPLGYTVVYVTGAADPADKTSSTGWNSGIGATGNDDTGFLVALTEALRKLYPIDPDRVYAIGFSNGAFMAHRLALEAGNTFAAVVSVAGAMPESMWKNRPESCAVSVFQITGEKDDVIPKNSDGSAKYSRMPAIEDVIGYYAEANGLETAETETIGKGSVLTRYSDAARGGRVWHLVVRDGRHSWSGESVTGIDTNQIILEFLEALGN